MNIGYPWNRIIERWKACNIPIRPATATEIVAFETQNQIALPPSVRDYFASVGGFIDGFDEALFRFWPLPEVTPVYDELAEPQSSVVARYPFFDCFGFADFCIDSWTYAVRLNSDPDQSAPVYRVTGSDLPPGAEIASSFLEFMQMYADDPDSIMG